MYQQTLSSRSFASSQIEKIHAIIYLHPWKRVFPEQLIVIQSIIKFIIMEAEGSLSITQAHRQGSYCEIAQINSFSVLQDSFQYFCYTYGQVSELVLSTKFFLPEFFMHLFSSLVQDTCPSCFIIFSFDAISNTHRVIEQSPLCNIKITAAFIPTTLGYFS